MALGGGSILGASRKQPIDLRTLAIMNSMTVYVVEHAQGHPSATIVVGDLDANVVLQLH